MSTELPETKPCSVAVSQDDGTRTAGGAVASRAAMREAAARVLKQIAQGAEHELVTAISSQDALEELMPLLDRLLAVGSTARLQDTAEGWREAHRRLLNASVLIRVAELRHAVGVKMDYMPTSSGDKAQVLEWLAALERLRAELQDHRLKAANSISGSSSPSTET